ncbi:MAG TPA: hypothetical protein VLS90_13415 [Thermodesulfobacteriota bacterium]|nr:hypothetical protein [Thermodesulfobacteriota bacterium]
MNGPVAQIVALTCHGNAFLRGHAAGPFFPSNSTCQFCECVRFATPERRILGKPKETMAAESPDAWFAELKSRDARGIRLFRTPENRPGFSDRILAGLAGGGGAWTAEVLLRGGRSEFWTARWEVQDRNAPDRRIWRVTYVRVSEGKPYPAKPMELGEATRELAQILKRVRAFSARMALDWFTKSFDEALDTIETKGNPPHGFHRDLAPPGFPSEEASALLDACQKAWVFGGMGSWNDLGFTGDDQKEYERVSERLFETVNHAIEMAASSTAPPVP